MKLYVILDRISKIEYGISDKLWLARLFYIQRYDTNHNLVLIHRKSKGARYLLTYKDRSIHYFSGHALLSYELEYINLVLLDTGIGYYRRKYKQRKVQRMLDQIEKSIIASSIADCIHRQSDVIDRLAAFAEWQYRVGGHSDYCY